MFVCKKCKERKPSSDFYRHSAMAIGFLSFCKECVKARVRLHRADNIDRIQEYDRERGLLPHRKAGVAARAHRYQRSARIMGSPSFEVGTTSETPLTQISLKGWKVYPVIANEGQEAHRLRRLMPERPVAQRQANQRYPNANPQCRKTFG